MRNLFLTGITGFIGSHHMADYIFKQAKIITYTTKHLFDEKEQKLKWTFY
tara:strand:- start:2520 stop:2669 length:150 start_codon:yes stop_codon:yes gene_type:complete